MYGVYFSLDMYGVHFSLIISSLYYETSQKGIRLGLNGWKFDSYYLFGRETRLPNLMYFLLNVKDYKIDSSKHKRIHVNLNTLLQ